MRPRGALGVVASLVALSVCASACKDDIGNAAGNATDATDGAHAADAGATGEADTASADTSGADAASIDSADGGADTASGPWTTDCPNNPGTPGCDCKSNADCDNNLCIDTPQGKRCARNCVDTCPPDYVCGQAPGSDTVSICLPEHLSLCAPCTTSKDCQVYKNGSVCVRYGGEFGSYCGSACTADADCPKNHACRKAESAEGTSVQQCVRVDGAGEFAQCSCTVWAAANAMSTACESSVLVDGKTVVCKGTRACAATGLTACSAAATDEVCDGIDNNCDGDIDNLVCDDGNPCTKDACAARSAPGSGKAGGCLHEAKQEGLPCDDGDACTDKDACKSGGAAGSRCTGTPKDCDDHNPCTDDTCDAGGCNSEPNTDPCDDGDPCTLGDKCTGDKGVGVCRAGLIRTCEDGNACTTEACDATSGKCEKKASPDGSPCDDGDPCTLSSACTSGACAAGARKVCTDADPCTADDLCDESGNCVFPPAAASCTDGVACTTDACKGGKCVSVADDGACDDGNACSTNTCDALHGCVAALKPGSCDDGNACTLGDRCGDKGGESVCLPGAVTACDDGNPCTSDSCDTGKGCVHAPVDGSRPCYSGSAESRGVGTCRSGTATCAEGALGACVGEVVPAPAEACDGRDDDCDGRTDEGCTPAALEVRTGWMNLGGSVGGGKDAPVVRARGSSGPVGTVAGAKLSVRYGWFARWLKGGK